MSNLTFTEKAFEEYLYWQKQDKKTLKRINALLKELTMTRLTVPESPNR